MGIHTCSLGSSGQTSQRWTHHPAGSRQEATWYLFNQSPRSGPQNTATYSQDWGASPTCPSWRDSALHRGPGSGHSSRAASQSRSHTTSLKAAGQWDQLSTQRLKHQGTAMPQGSCEGQELAEESSRSHPLYWAWTTHMAQTQSRESRQHPHSHPHCILPDPRNRA